MYCFVAEFRHAPIPVDGFAAHVKFMHTDGDYRFNQEFEVKSIIVTFSFFLKLMFTVIHCVFLLKNKLVSEENTEDN